MRRPKKDIQLTSYDELLGLEETPEKSMNQVVEIDLAKLYPFKNHPFHVNDDEKMAETVESIKTYGVLTPALVRPRPDGGYEMISGHRRKRGCELCGKTTLPALVRNYTDDEAVIIMVDSNIQRENLLPSEKAHAYKMKYDAMKHQGSKGKKYTADMVGEAAGDSGRTVQRYIRLAALSDALLEYVDNNKIPMIVGEKLSYLKPEEQGWLLEVITNSSIFPTKQQAEQLKECSANGKLNQSYIYAVLLKKESSKINVTLMVYHILCYLWIDIGNIFKRNHITIHKNGFRYDSCRNSIFTDKWFFIYVVWLLYCIFFIITRSWERVSWFLFRSLSARNLFYTCNSDSSSILGNQRHYVRPANR